MKKFLLIAVAVLITGSAIAQSAKTEKAFSATNVNKGEIRSVVGKTVKPFEGKLFNRLVKGQELVQLSQKEASSLKASRVVKAQAPRRAGVLQTSYNGIGVNYKTKENVSWTMRNVTDGNGTLMLADVIPLPESWASMQSIAVNYTLDGNTITIQPQKVASDDNYFYYLHSWTSASGAIVLTLNDDGTLTTIDNEDIAYSAFTEDRFDLSTGGPYKEVVLDIENVKYYAEGQELPRPTAGYEPEGLFLCVSPNVNGSYYTSLMIPANGDITLINRTSGFADTYNWYLQAVKYNSTSQTYEPDGEPITATTKDFTFKTGVDITYSPAQLAASFNGAESEPFTWSRNVWLAGAAASYWNNESNPTYTFSKANPIGELTYLNPNGVRSVILYQGKPASPLYFTGINTMIYQFAQTSAQVPVSLTCKIYKAHRDATGSLTMGELVAQSDLNTELIETGNWFPTRLNWTSFYVKDEAENIEYLDYIFMEDEFAVVLEGWDNGTFSGYPLAFRNNNAKGVSSTFAITSQQEEFSGAGWSLTGDVILGFIDAAYGYLYTTDNTDLTLPAEGGQATIHIKPMFRSIDDETQQPTVRLFTDKIVVDGEEVDEWPAWLTTEIINEDYTEGSEHYMEYDLVVKAEALPDGAANRKAEITYYQEGALLRVSVQQNAVPTGISQTKVADRDNNGKRYDISGRQVTDGKKGLVIRNNKKFIAR